MCANEATGAFPLFFTQIKKDISKILRKLFPLEACFVHELLFLKPVPAKSYNFFSNLIPQHTTLKKVDVQNLVLLDMLMPLRIISVFALFKGCHVTPNVMSGDVLIQDKKSAIFKCFHHTFHYIIISFLL